MLEAHQNLGEALAILYGESAFRVYAVEVGRTLAQSMQLRNKVEVLSTNVKRQCEQTLEKVAELKTAASERESARVFFDHYRSKIAKLEKTHRSTTDMKKLEVYNRNVLKNKAAREKFEIENRRLNEILDLVSARV